MLIAPFRMFFQHKERKKTRKIVDGSITFNKSTINTSNNIFTFKRTPITE